MMGEYESPVESADCEVEVELRLQVQRAWNSDIEEVVMRVRPNKVDLTAHPYLRRLPEALRDCAARVRELRVASVMLLSLPDWIGELVNLEVLCVGGMVGKWGRLNGYHLHCLPVRLGSLTALRTLELRDCCDLKELPRELRFLTALEDLDLMGCIKLKDVSAWVKGLPNLRVPFEEWHPGLPVRPDRVDLTAYKHLRELPAALQRCAARVLELRVESGYFSTLPSWLGELTSLESLNLSRCRRLTALPAALRALTALQALHLSGCVGLAALPAELGALTALTTLNLARCEGLTALPAALGALTALQILDLQRCTGLMALPAELGALKALKILDLSGCEGLVTLPAELGALMALERLNLLYCGKLMVLPAELGALTALKTLDISKCNGLTALPGELGALTRLETLDLNKCEALTALPASLGLLTGLKKLHLFECKALVALPESLGTLTALEKLDLSRCSELRALPAKLGALTALKALNLSNCSGVTALPVELGALTALQSLDLSMCSHLTSLPAELGAIAALKEMNLQGCSALHTPPPAVVRAGTAAVLRYLHDLAKGSAPCHLAKVVLLGGECAGKSSLADSLVLGCPTTRAADDRTVGIDVRRWWLGGSKGFFKDKELVVNIYDNAGQRVYRASHPLFMTDDALFLHVVKSDASEDEAVMAVLEWVEAVQQAAPGAVMGIVWTRSDLVCGLQWEEIGSSLPTTSTEITNVTLAAALQTKVEFSKAEYDTFGISNLSKSSCIKAGASYFQPVDGGAAARCQVRQAVLLRVTREIERHVRAVDKAMQEAENVFEVNAEWCEKKQLRDSALELLDLNSIVKYCVVLDRERHMTTIIEGGKEDRGQRLRVDHQGIQGMTCARERLESLHHEMQELEERTIECSAERPSYDDLRAKLQRLRLQRVRRVRILFSYAVSSHTGHGLEVLREALASVLKDKRLFPHVGGMVPLNYAMLEKLAHEGRTPGRQHFENGGEDAARGVEDAASVSQDDASSDGAAPTHAAWEGAVAKHLNATASEGLRMLCSQPFVKAKDLEKEAALIGMDKEELHSALRFLHSIGSVLHYG